MDGGDPARTGSALIIVRVEDVDDNTAVMTKKTYQWTVTENSPEGQVVGVVTAVDNDLPPHNIVYYQLFDDHSDSFSIDLHNGLSAQHQQQFTSVIESFSQKIVEDLTIVCKFYKTYCE